MAVYTTIDNPELYFQTKLYTGAGANQSITLDGSEDMQPNLVWIKDRTNTNNQVWTDSVRGVEKVILSNAGNAEATYTDGLTAFNSDGFSLGDDDDGQMNVNTNACVAWCWKESATAGFDIVSYAGSSGAKTESHSLSAVPSVIIVKNISASANWRVYHVSQGNTKAAALNSSGEQAVVDSGFWNDTTPTSSVFTIGSGYADSTNASGNNFISYLWAGKQGYSKFGSYTGNGNANGPYIHLGFRPAMIIVKSATETRNWRLWDNKRSTFNLTDEILYPDLSNAEATGDSEIDMLSNGFKLRKNSDNTSGETYIYMAFAEQPFVNSKGVPANAR